MTLKELLNVTLPSQCLVIRHIDENYQLETLLNKKTQEVAMQKLDTYLENEVKHIYTQTSVYALPTVFVITI